MATTTASAKTYTQKEINTISRVVYAESLNQPFLGKAAVAQVVINRYESGKYGKSLDYITRRSQFAKTGTWILKTKNKGSKALFKKCVDAVNYAIKNRFLPANTYNFQRANRKYWGGSKKIIKYCTIGAHTFYTHGKPVFVIGEGN